MPVTQWHREAFFTIASHQLGNCKVLSCSENEAQKDTVRTEDSGGGDGDSL